jgi:CHAT domain-containing protein
MIASAEPLLPWEMMIPTRMDAADIEESRSLPIGVEFRVGRWIRSDTKPPQQRLQVAESYLVAASNSNPRRALDSSRERQVLERLYGGQPIIPAKFAELNAFFAAHSAPLVHFVCHGAAEEFDDAIFLDEDERCSSTRIRNAAGFKALMRARRPLVFLNACDTAQMAAVLGGGAGFPLVLTNLGARAVIAPLWPVAQSVAAEVAVQLYEGAAREPERTLADLLRDQRRRSYEEEPFEDSYASYCLFGDPSMRLERAP